MLDLPGDRVRALDLGRLDVEDTETDTVKTYRNELGQAAEAVTDTDAFATCP